MIYELIEENHERTGGHCGITIVGLCLKTRFSAQEVRQELTKLYKEKKIIVKQGLNHKLFYINGSAKS